MRDNFLYDDVLVDVTEYVIIIDNLSYYL